MKHTVLRTTHVIALLAVASALLLPGMLFAQSATGALQGRIIDEGGGVIPGATVVAANAATGFSRTAVSTQVGNFVFPALPAGTYTVKFELQGYATMTMEEVVINVAATRKLDVTMKLAAVKEEIIVISEAPLVASSASLGTVVSQEELETLPLNGRQFANLAVLAPGTTLAYNSDPTKPGQLVVQLGGGGGRNVNYVMDGGDNTDDTIGGALQNFNLEAVQEFNIQTMLYKAEYGRSSGGVLSVVTKSGTNEFSGAAYGYFRDTKLNTQTETEKQAGVDKQDYKRKQYGLALGGPIVKDKAHFFATYEKTKRDTNYAVDTDGAFPTFDGTIVPTPFEDQMFTAKATYDIDTKNYLQVRYGYQKNSDKYGASPLASPDALGTVDNKYSSILAGYTAQIGDDKFNEFVFQYTKFDNLISADSSDPQIYYPSGFHTGENLNTPQSTHQVKYQYKDDFSFTRTIAGDSHDFKLGVGYVDEPTLGGDFSTGLAGQYYAINDSLTSPIGYIEKYGGFFGDKTPNKQYSVYFQDDWQVNADFTLNIGIRYDYFDCYDFLDQKTNAIWQTLHT
ncbi:MAG: TonB-dependent receptor, partial [Acidobacteriota bacterium]